jgi:cell division protein FtsN
MGIIKVKKILFVFVFFTLCSFSFAQNIKITGSIPKADTGKLYQLQIGAYRLSVNVNHASDVLKKNGFTPRCENKGDLVRVFIVVKANEVRSAIDRLCKAGFKELIIREYSGLMDTKPAEPKPVEKKPAETKPVEKELDIEIIEEAFHDDEVWIDAPVFDVVEPELIHLYAEE